MSAHRLLQLQILTEIYTFLRSSKLVSVLQISVTIWREKCQHISLIVFSLGSEHPPHTHTLYTHIYSYITQSHKILFMNIYTHPLLVQSPPFSPPPPHTHFTHRHTHTSHKILFMHISDAI